MLDMAEQPETQRIETQPTESPAVDAPAHGTSRPATSWAQRAEDRAASPTGGRSRLAGQLVTPFLAVLPWAGTVVGCLLLARATTQMQMRFEQSWGLIIGGALVLVIAAVGWAAITAWSSSGAVVAGLCTMATGVFVATRPGMQAVSQLGQSGPVPVQYPLYSVATPLNLLVLGSMLLALGLAASAARRLGRRHA